MPSDSQPIILWLHNDLRLSDHRAWFEAAQNGAPVIPVYLHYKAIGGANRWWLHQSLAALQAELRTKNSDILLGVADSPESIAQQLSTIAKHYHTDKIFCHQPPTPFDGVQNKVISLAPSLHFTRFDQGHTLVNPNELLNGQGQAYKVFTPFYKAFRASHLPAPPLPAVKPSTFVPYQASLPLDALHLRPTIAWDEDFYAHWQAGEVAAQIKLNELLEGSFLADYDTDRNRPDIEGTSRLSPHLHFGEITPRQLIWALWDHPHADTFIREILWREFAYYIHAHFPHTFEQPFQAKWQGFQWEINAEALSRWQKGQTGIPLVDAGMRQLWQTGWMHNRAHGCRFVFSEKFRDSLARRRALVRRHAGRRRHRGQSHQLAMGGWLRCGCCALFPGL
jgi:deoxyribodipyrimidine photo-lyase